MTKYRLLAPHIVGGAYCPTGEVVDIDYDPSPQMEPLDADGRRKLEAFNKDRAELEPDYPNSGWPLIDKLWHGYLIRDRLRTLRDQAQETHLANMQGALQQQSEPHEHPGPDARTSAAPANRPEAPGRRK